MKEKMTISASNRQTPSKVEPNDEIGWQAGVRAAFTLLLPLVLFLAAGRFDWWHAWITVALLVVFAVVSRLIVSRKYPDLLTERAHYTVC